jgi:hypothetical protein
LIAVTGATLIMLKVVVSSLIAVTGAI